MRVMLFPQDFDAGTSGVSENQNVPASATRKRSFLKRIAENSPAVPRIVAADADDGVAWHRGHDLVDLKRQRLLQSDQIGVASRITSNSISRRTDQWLSPSLAVP